MIPHFSFGCCQSKDYKKGGFWDLFAPFSLFNLAPLPSPFNSTNFISQQPGSVIFLGFVFCPGCIWLHPPRWLHRTWAVRNHFTNDIYLYFLRHKETIQWTNVIKRLLSVRIYSLTLFNKQIKKHCTIVSNGGCVNSRGIKTHLTPTLLTKVTSYKKQDQFEITDWWLIKEPKSLSQTPTLIPFSTTIFW